MSSLAFVQVASGLGVRPSSRCLGHCGLRPRSVPTFLSGRSLLRPVNLVWAPAKPNRPIRYIGMSSSGSGTSPLIRIAAGIMATGLIISSLLPFTGGFKNAFSDNGSALVDAKLHKVPVFTVSDEEGRPFMVETDDHLSRKGYFFVSPDDAEEYLARVKDGTEDAKVLPVGLDEALKFTLKRRNGGSKSVPETFTLFPSERELDVAETTTNGEFGKIFPGNSVPIYYADGLAFSVGSSGGASSEATANVYPLFFSKSSLEKTLATLREKDPAAEKAIGEIEVLSLDQTVREMRSGTNPRLDRVMFIPLDESLKALRASSAAPARK